MQKAAHLRGLCFGSAPDPIKVEPGQPDITQFAIREPRKGAAGDTRIAPQRHRFDNPGKKTRPIGPGGKAIAVDNGHVAFPS
ncbi:hypothetical protein C8J27_11155 [Rhodobacter aestuarii]|uniref:Uncharacterized protein n=1 Tax=Rhodobacter aestuarii TaxID=453582 RepID=A0A1N7Q547_9RHOB|nr:hypothetical protein C8J27_11155 [Rhodobacter aestuarii]SIT17992.1 hypothetical protein SAMN05421580_11322 [Rhodobacter aestuarii]